MTPLDIHSILPRASVIQFTLGQFAIKYTRGRSGHQEKVKSFYCTPEPMDVEGQRQNPRLSS